MAALPEAAELLAFCLREAARLAKRDWLASLTLLTTRRRLDRRSPDFLAYNACVVARAGLLELRPLPRS